MHKIILASASPRRKELLSQIGLKFDVVTCETDETFEKTEKCSDIVQKLAYNKAFAVAKKVDYKSIVIGADTLVALNGEILGKPNDEKHAFFMLKSLSGKTHQVYTGYCIIRNNDNKIITKYEETNVTFVKLSDADINYYIQSKEPMDKAGAYGIQGIGGAFVKYIKGDYSNVVGLPLYSVASCFKTEFDISFYDNIY